MLHLRRGQKERTAEKIKEIFDGDLYGESESATEVSFKVPLILPMNLSAYYQSVKP